MDPLNGNAPPNGVQGDDAPKYITTDDLNRAITARLQEYGKRQEKHFSTLLEAFTSKLDEKFQGFGGNPPPGNEGGNEKPPNIQDHPEFKGVLKRLQETEARTKAAEERATAERAKSMDSTLRQKLGDELTKHGVDAKYGRHAIGLLVDADKRVRYSEDGERIVWRDDDNAELDLTTGIKAWAKSDDAKPYLPPRGTAGSGAKPGGGNGQQQTNGDMGEDAARLLMQHLTGA